MAQFPGTASGPCFGLADSPWLTSFPLTTPPKLPLLCSLSSSVLFRHPTASLRSSSIRIISFLLRPRLPQGRMKLSQVPMQGIRSCLNSLDTVEPCYSSPSRCSKCCLRPSGRSRHSKYRTFRCSIVPPTRSATDASPASSRIHTHGSRRGLVVSLSPPPDFHRLPSH